MRAIHCNCGTVTMYCTHVLEYFEGLRRNKTALDVMACMSQYPTDEDNTNKKSFVEKLTLPDAPAWEATRT